MSKKEGMRGRQEEMMRKGRQGKRRRMGK